MANEESCVQGRENSKYENPKLGTCLVCSKNIEVGNITGARRWKESEFKKEYLARSLKMVVAWIRVVAVELQIMWYIWMYIFWNYRLRIDGELGMLWAEREQSRVSPSIWIIRRLELPSTTFGKNMGEKVLVGGKEMSGLPFWTY